MATSCVEVSILWYLLRFVEQHALLISPVVVIVVYSIFYLFTLA